MSTTNDHRERHARAAVEHAAELAEYHVLAAYDLRRTVRYGDMARSRRGRELNRLADRLIDAGVRVDRDGNFPPSSHDELVAAWDRVAAPRIRRLERESYRHGTRYTQATLAAWRVTWAEISGRGIGAVLSGDAPVPAPAPKAGGAA